MKAAHFTQREKDGRLTVSSSMNDLGPYGTGSHDIDVMARLPVISTQWRFPREHGKSMPTLTVADILDTLLESSYPDALDALVYRGGKEGASGFSGMPRAPWHRPVPSSYALSRRRTISIFAV